MTPLRQALVDYLRIRRQLGFKLVSDQRHLENFVAFLERAGAERITVELAVMWARLPADAVSALVEPAAGDRARLRALSGHGRPRKRGAIRRTFWPPTARGSPPYIYAPGEIRALMAAARALHAALARGGIRDRDRADGRQPG